MKFSFWYEISFCRGTMLTKTELLSGLKIANRAVWGECHMRIWSGAKTTPEPFGFIVRMPYKLRFGTKLIPECKSFLCHINSSFNKLPLIRTYSLSWGSIARVDCTRWSLDFWIRIGVSFPVCQRTFFLSIPVSLRQKNTTSTVYFILDISWTDLGSPGRSFVDGKRTI